MYCEHIHRNHLNMDTKALVLLTICLTTVAAIGELGCKFPEEINLPSGVITSPYYDYPEHGYPNSAKCRFLINVPHNKNILVSFLDAFGLEGYPEESGGCYVDTITFYTPNRTSVGVCAWDFHGPSFDTLVENNNLAGPYCGETSPGSLVFNTSSLVIEFCTDSSTAGPGFRLAFNATDLSATLPPTVPTKPEVACQNKRLQIKDSETIYIQSPYHPENYPSDTECRWTITSPVGTAMSITALEFVVEGFGDPVTGNLYDYITITDVLRNKTKYFTGADGPIAHLTYENEVEIRFVSDQTGEYSGFNISIQVARCNAEYTGCPNDPEGDVCDFHPKMLCDGVAQCPGGADEFCPTECGKAKTPPYFSAVNKIVHGIEARPHSWPWQVALFTHETFHCGGTIIDHYFVMTAAHCCVATSTKYLTVRVGDHHLYSDREPNQLTYALRSITMHPKYDTNPTTYDFCLLETAAPILFHENDILPICLPSPIDPPVDKRCYVTGWGEVRQNDWQGRTMTKATSNTLRQVDVKVVDQNACNRIYDGIITQDMLCARSIGDSCQGDSGGPMQCSTVEDPLRFELTGVVSWAYGCADPKYPGVNGRVSHVIDWIVDILIGHTPSQQIASPFRLRTLQRLGKSRPPQS